MNSLDAKTNSRVECELPVSAAQEDLSFWASAPGTTLLETVKLLPGLQVLDIGCGTGFPSLELASRLGALGHVRGLDPSVQALEWARAKARARNIGNVEFKEGFAECMPFENASFELLVSNNGLNNVGDLRSALRECARVARPRAQVVMTANLPGTFALFYEFLELLFEERRWTECMDVLKKHIEDKRKPVETWKMLWEDAGFSVRKILEKSLTWSFMDGRALLRHAFIREHFLPAWCEIPPAEHRDEFMGYLEGRLNRLALERGGLHLEVPYFCLDAMRNAD